MNMCCTIVALAGVLVASGAAAAQSAFAARVVDYSPAPGQFVNNPAFNDPSRAIGAPVGGGTASPDNSKLVTLGGFGGSITLAFDRTVLDDPANPLGLDCIVFGNASFVAGDPNRRFAEAATIEVSLDVNGNGVADDAWYLIPGSHLPEPQAAWTIQTWDDNISDGTHPPALATWVPPGRAGQWTTGAHQLPDLPFAASVVLVNPLGDGAATEGVFGYADHTPTLVLGDLDGDNIVDDPLINPEEFYTTPDDPLVVGISTGCGGGDAFDIAWAVDPVTGEAADLQGFDFIRITTAVNRIWGQFGETSAEIGGVADVRPAAPAADWNGDGAVDTADFFEFIAAFFGVPPDADFNGDGATDTADFFEFIAAFFG